MASSAPPGVIPNYTDPVSIGHQLVQSSLITGAFALTAVAARWITKLWISRSVGLDDYFSLAALVFAVGRIIGGCIMVYDYGTGRHAWDDPIAKALKTTSVEVAINALYLWAIMFAKLSILALYVRIFGVNLAFKRTCYGIAGIVVVYCVACTPMYILGCVPSGARTIAQVDHGQCVKTIPLNIAIGALNIATDTALLVLPIPLLLRLQISNAKRLGLFAVFATGLVAWAASIVREIQFVKDVHVTDGTWTQVADVMWLTIEMNIGILAGCLPVLYPLGQRVAQYETLRSTFSTLSDRSRQVRRKLSSTRRSSENETSKERDSESLQELKDRSGQGHRRGSKEPAYDVENGVVNEAGVATISQTKMLSPETLEQELNLTMIPRKDRCSIVQSGKMETERGRHEGY